jgi:EAL domain-containing protein (putative c-di-GMP-specific phosphodiesterase class I)
MLEDCQTIEDLGFWVISEVAKDKREGQRTGIDLMVSVNIAARQFVSDGFAKSALEMIESYGIDPTTLEVEVTEETILQDPVAAMSALRDLREAGIRIALDDFGRGYSNLGRLAELPVDTIKIDGTLIARVTTDKRVETILKSAVAMADELGCETVAEGVETPDQAAMMSELGCTMLQGYYFSRPIPADQIPVWISERSASPIGKLQDHLSRKIAAIA